MRMELALASSRNSHNAMEQIEEGICQLMSYLFLKYKHMMEGTDSNALEARLRKFYMQQIKHDISPIYGDGFREAYAAYKRVNSLQRMFDAIRQHGAFP
ncbi:hypothetical protein PsorP6_011195 [Peronosclerospora sorghi]|uniref:Uncharacterized protein n=1 Tax=Peronosclerospora sorghi TaxID=230839 RepID=A0ACC0VWQ0_9STRA|nr:hypothetical protein PsorP6_011195 [Peronosclerospora sorghi]